MNLINSDALTYNFRIKFDVIVMNPPYQEQKEGFKKTQPLWHKFVENAINSLKENGYLVAVHPSGWRDVDGVFKNTQLLMRSKYIIKLNMYHFKDGLKNFAAKTTYDYYCLKNTEKRKKTIIKCQNGDIEISDISNMELIPNGMFKEYERLLAVNGEESVLIISDSTYHTQRELMNKTKTDNFKYSCVYTTTADNKVNFWYSNTNTNGHFGISKIFWSNGYAPTVHIDINGNYGLTQFAYAIIDEPKNLEYIKRALEHPDFLKIMRPVEDGHTHKYDRKIISLFRKDFWKEFITENAAKII